LQRRNAFDEARLLRMVPNAEVSNLCGKAANWQQQAMPKDTPPVTTYFYQ